jgi:hypothetical protein
MWCDMPDDFSDAFEEQVGAADARAPDCDAGVSINDFVAYMPQHSYIFMPARELWPAASVNARVPSPGLDADGKPIAAATWLDVHRPVEQMTWAPGKPMLVRDKLIADGGWIDQPGCTVFNLYKPPIVKPTTGDVSPRLDLIKKTIRTKPIVYWLFWRTECSDPMRR